MRHKCGGGYAASRQEKTARGGGAPPIAVCGAIGAEKKMTTGAGFPKSGALVQFLHLVPV